MCDSCSLTQHVALHECCAYASLVSNCLAFAGAGVLQQLIELGGEGAELQGLNLPNVMGGSSDNSNTTSQSTGSSKLPAPSEGADAKHHGTATGGVARIPRLEGDFSLNAANVLSAGVLLRSGLSRLCPTHDLNVSLCRTCPHGHPSRPPGHATLYSIAAQVIQSLQVQTANGQITSSQPTNFFMVMFPC